MNIIGIICGVVVAVGCLIVFLCQLIKNDIVIVFIVTRLAIAIAAGLTVAMALSI